MNAHGINPYPSVLSGPYETYSRLSLTNSIFFVRCGRVELAVPVVFCVHVTCNAYHFLLYLNVCSVLK